jgi:hypothetical protein
MRQLLYVSNTSRSLPRETLDSILKVSRHNNEASDITGLLLYLDGSFLQVLEGDTDAIDRTYARIRQDKRHWGARLLLDQDVPRAFSDWSMGFHQPFVDGADGGFAITKPAIEQRLAQGATPELVTFLQTFYRVHLGDNFERASHAI